MLLGSQSWRQVLGENSTVQVGDETKKITESLLLTPKRPSTVHLGNILAENKSFDRLHTLCSAHRINFFEGYSGSYPIHSSSQQSIDSEITASIGPTYIPNRLPEPPPPITYSACRHGSPGVPHRGASFTLKINPARATPQKKPCPPAGGFTEMTTAHTCMTVFRSARLLSCVLQRASGLWLPSS